MSEYFYSDELLREATNKLRKLNILTPELDCCLLLSYAANFSEKLYLHNKVLISKQQRELFYSILNERINGKPVSRILGYRHFWKNKFFINDFTLDPRADSETIIEAVLKKFDKSNMKAQILDLGAGSGALGLSIIDEMPNSRLLSLDKCHNALRQISFNAKKLNLSDRLETINLDWFDNDWKNQLKNKIDKSDLLKKSKFDIIVCNPPYIRSNDIKKLSKEVKNFDPLISLDGGKDGCASYKAIFGNLRIFLKSNGVCFLEIGFGTFNNVKKILDNFNFKIIHIHKDLNKIDRVLEII